MTCPGFVGDGDLIAAVVDRAAERLAAQRHRRSDLDGQLSTLDMEIRRLTSAIASSELPPVTLIDALRARETARQRVERELKACGATFDRAKLRETLRRHAKDWRALLKRRTENARLILQKFVAERFVFTPDGAGGYHFRGQGSIGALLHQMASPRGTALRRIAIRLRVNRPPRWSRVRV